MITYWNFKQYSGRHTPYWRNESAYMYKQKCRLWFLSVVKTNLLQNQIKSRWIAYSLWHAHTRLTARTTRVSRYQKGKTNVDFTEARDSEWQWHQLGRMQVCTLLQTDNHASTPPLSFLQAGCPSCRPTNGVKALNSKIQSMTILTKHKCV